MNSTDNNRYNGHRSLVFDPTEDKVKSLSDNKTLHCNDLKNPVEWLYTISKHFIEFMGYSYMYDLSKKRNEYIKMKDHGIINNNIVINTEHIGNGENVAFQDLYALYVSNQLRFWVPLPSIYDEYMKETEDEINNIIKKAYEDYIPDIVNNHTRDLQIYIIEENQQEYLKKNMSQCIILLKQKYKAKEEECLSYLNDIVMPYIDNIFLTGYSHLSSILKNYNELKKKYEMHLDSLYGENERIYKYIKYIMIIKKKCLELCRYLLDKNMIAHSIDRLDKCRGDGNVDILEEEDLKIRNILETTQQLLKKQDPQLTDFYKKYREFRSKWAEEINRVKARHNRLTMNYDEKIHYRYIDSYKIYEGIYNDLNVRFDTEYNAYQSRIRKHSETYDFYREECIGRLRKYMTNMSLKVLQDDREEKYSFRKKRIKQQERIALFIENMNVLQTLYYRLHRLKIFKEYLSFSTTMWKKFFLDNKRYIFS